MRVVMIKDEDGQALLDKLELDALRIDPMLVVSGSPGLQTCGDIHRRFHFEVVRWLHDHGWRKP